MNQPIYLDYNATTLLSPLVKAELVRLLQLDLGNPSSRHWAGVPAAEIVELSRIRIASLIGCDPTEIIFTSGGTEANNHAIKGVFFANKQQRKQPHFIISSVEHPAVTEPLRFLKTLGARATRVPVDAYGFVDPIDVQRAIEPETFPVVLQWVLRCPKWKIVCVKRSACISKECVKTAWRFRSLHRSPSPSMPPSRIKLPTNKGVNPSPQ